MTSPNPDEKERETVYLDDILNSANISPGKEMTTHAIGYRLAIFVLIYISVVTAILMVNFLLKNPSLPDLSTCTPDALANYQAIRTLNAEQTYTLFEKLVQNSILPIFSAILGYIFGTRGIEKGGE